MYNGIITNFSDLAGYSVQYFGYSVEDENLCFPVNILEVTCIKTQ